MRPGPLVVAAVVAATSFVGLVIAQSPPRARPTLHEPIPDLNPDKPGPTIGGAHDTNPTAFAAGDKVLPKPTLDKGAGPDKGGGGGGSGANKDPVLGSKDFSADRDTVMKPDKNTGSDGTLHYVSVFNPDVLPFKRMSTFDSINDDFTLHVARMVLTELPVGGTYDPKTRDRFWGDVMVELHPGVDVALPSVAPDMRILSYEVKPNIRLKFSKDGADNFYVRSDEGNAGGVYHLVFYADADAGYFAPAMPKHTYYVRDIPALTPPELKPLIPAVVMTEAKLTMQKYGLNRDMRLDVALNDLIEWGRAFQAGEIRNSSGTTNRDTYRDLCDSKVGVCRHRAFAFMVTANALGIPTRLVENEAHAFVEVWLPERNWQRIDLGGAALRMDVAGMSNKTLHRPRSEDPFAKPPEYKNNYTQLEGDIKGLSDQQLADKRRPLDQAPASGAIGANGGIGTGSASKPQFDRITPDQTLPAVTPDQTKLTPKLVVTQASQSAYRGDLIHVEGLARVTDTNAPVGDHLIAVFLSPLGEHGGHAIQIGNAKTNSDGLFKVDLPLPAQLNLSTYEIFLSSNSDVKYNAALSD